MLILLLEPPLLDRCCPFLVATIHLYTIKIDCVTGQLIFRSDTTTCFSSFVVVMPTRNPNPRGTITGRGNPLASGRGGRSFPSPPDPGKNRSTDKHPPNQPTMVDFFPPTSTQDASTIAPSLSMEQSSDVFRASYSDISSNEIDNDDSSTYMDTTMESPAGDDDSHMKFPTPADPPSPQADLQAPPHQSSPAQASTNNLFPVDMEDMSDDGTINNGIPPARVGPPRQTPIPSPLPVQDFTLKFLFQASHQVSTNEAAGRCLSVLSAIAKLTSPSPIKIFDKNGNVLTKFGQSVVTSFNNYLPLLKHKNNFWTVFKIRSQLPFLAIRQNDVVFHTLQSTNGRLSVYPWEPDVTNVWVKVEIES